MNISGSTAGTKHKATAVFSAALDQVSIKHYLRLLMHRKWIVLGVFVLVSAATVVFSSRLPDVYSSETLILVDPQKVPESYVKATVTGDIRNRLGTLSQQILSVTRLQKIIERLNLYPEERKHSAREEIVARMRRDIDIAVRSDFSSSQDLQAFRIRYSGKEPRLVAQVTTELASLFIDENLKSREQQATGTTEFLQNQLNETRKVLEAQEGQIRDFKMKHVGEMPEQLNSTIQILGQLQSQYQLEGEALARAEQQKSYLQSMISQSVGVVDIDDPAPPKPAAVKDRASPASPANTSRARLDALLARGYTDQHPDVRKLRAQIEDEDAQSKSEHASRPSAVAAAEPSPAPAAPPPSTPRRPLVPANFSNPVLTSQLQSVEAEIAKRKQEHERLAKAVAGYRAKLEAIPIREQQITQVVRDYEITKTHYSQLLEKNLSAEQATQLEIRQKGEKFAVLDPAQVPERPSSPNRPLINLAGSLAGLALGFALALVTELGGMSITEPQQIASVSGLAVLEVIPIIRTHADRRRWRSKGLWAAVSAAIAVLAVGAALLYRYGNDFVRF